MTRLSRHTLGIVLVVALVALAGCSGDNGSGTATPTDTTATTAANTTADTGGDGNGTDGNGTDGNLTSLDQQLVNSHAISLIEAGNYSVENSTSHNETSVVTNAAVNLNTVSKYTQITTFTASGTINVEEYRESGSSTVYQQLGSGESARYYTLDASGEFPGNEISRPYIITDVNYTQFGTDTVEGTTVERYVANGANRVAGSADGWGGLVTNFSSTIEVDADQRLIYEIDAEYTVARSGRLVNESYTITYSDVGSTNVTEPSWLSEAKSGT